MTDTPPSTAAHQAHPATAHAEQLAETLPPLLVRAERIAATVTQGVHGRRRVGSGEQFWQFRRYQPGEAATAIDWRQTAKRERAYVRQQEWTAAQTVLLWSAGGPAMDWRSAPHLPTKRERARLLTLALGALLLRGGERVGLLEPYERPATGRGTLTRIATAMERTPAGDDLPAASQARHATVVLIGDFLAPLDKIERALRVIATNGAHGHLLQVLDPAEESLPYEGRVSFTAVIGDDSWLVSRAEEVRAAYVARLAAHRNALRTMTATFGWTFALHHTDGPPEPPLLSLFQAMSQAPAERWRRI